MIDVSGLTVRFGGACSGVSPHLGREGVRAGFIGKAVQAGPSGLRLGLSSDILNDAW